MAARGEPELSPGDWAVLGALSEGATHGFALAQLVGPDGELGRIWSLPRPVVYQSLKKLTGLGLVTERAVESSDRGPRRTIVAVTPSGQRAVRRWLSAPVDHVRDVRSLLLLKLALLHRAGRDPGDLLAAQRQLLEPLTAALKQRRDAASGFERTLADWRLESSRAVLRFVRSAARDRARLGGAAQRSPTGVAPS